MISKLIMRDIRSMRSKEEIALVWIALGIITVPFIILNPGILVFALVGYCLYVLHDHYRR